MPDPSKQTLQQRLDAIPKLPESQLAEAWAALFGRPPPRGMSRRLLELAAAYEAQAIVYGGLRQSTRRKLIDWARRRATPTEKKPEVKPRMALSPGTRLVREWHGRTCTIEVTEQGFLYAGQRYRSLSAVARIITGARWSGRRFFGL
jgi:DUF2924 family protein